MAFLIDERTLRRSLIAIASGGLFIGLAIAFIDAEDPMAGYVWTTATLPVIAALVFSMVRDIREGRVGVDVVAFLAMAGALALGEPLAGVVIAVMYAGGNVLEDLAVARAERNLKSLTDRAPRIAHHRLGDTVEDVPVDAVLPGDVLIVRAGEIIPVDGVLLSECATIDEAALTGEPLPANRVENELVHSGTLNAGEAFEFRASATAGESTYAGIVQLVTAAQTAKAPFIRMADRYAALLIPITLAVAGIAWFISGDAVRALAVLVAATPCPLIIAAPVAFIAGVSQAARRGILIKGGSPLEALAHTHTVMFDKTGTLTVGGARLVAVETAPGETAETVLHYASSLEQASHHVVAAAIVAAAKARGVQLSMPAEVRESPGSGLEGIVDGAHVRAGSYALIYNSRRPEEWVMRALRRASWRSALTVFVTVDGRTIGTLLLGDELRRETPRAVQMLRSAGVARIVMVTGDRADAAETIGAALDLDEVLADRVPSDKLDAVSTEERLHRTLMVGDGINDAPALAAANVGVAMGARGATASSEAADVVILVDRLDRVSEAVAIARRTRSIAMQSILAGMGLSGLAMLAAAWGWLTPVAGAVTQELIDVAVILNALRALRPGARLMRRQMPATAAQELREVHEELAPSLDRLRTVADALDDADAANAVPLIVEANRIVAGVLLQHEREDESVIYPRLAEFLSDNHGLSAMSRAHREIIHLARLLSLLADGLRPEDADRYLIRDAQRVIESVEALVRIHNAQEEDIYEHAAAA